MPKRYYMFFVKGIPNSTQIKWFVERYSESAYKNFDLRHINNNKSSIDNNKEYIGVYMKDDDEYHYFFKSSSLDSFKSYTEVFYIDNDVPLGEL